MAEQSQNNVVFQEKNLIQKASHTKALVNVHLNLEDIEMAVQRFEGLAKDHKKLSQKFRLMEKLIEVRVIY